MRKILYSIILINICFQIVYLTFGRMVNIELTNFKYIFYIFRPEYMIFSGIIAILVLFILLMFSILLILFKLLRKESLDLFSSFSTDENDVVWDD